MAFYDDRRFVRALRLDRGRVPDFSAYPFCLPLVRNLDELALAQVTVLVGENGSGKSTLLEAAAAACGFNPEGGTLNYRFATRESHSPLWEYLRPVRGLRRIADGYFLRAESFYNAATYLERLDREGQAAGLGSLLASSYGGRSLHEMSHGESFLTLVRERFHGGGLYVLDEPEAALSPSSQLALLALMRTLSEQGAQFLLATHSPLLMALPGALLYQVGDGGARPCALGETSHYQILHAFFTRRQTLLDELFRDGPAPSRPKEG